MSFRGVIYPMAKGGSANVSGPAIQQQDQTLLGRRVVLVGKLASMSRRDAEQVIRERGGELVERFGDGVDLIVVSDEQGGLRSVAADRELFGDEVRARIAAGDVELVRESEFWGRIGLVDSGEGIQRLYTPAMLAELVRAPVAAIRQWHRRGALRATREVRRLAYFDFEEVRVARKLAELLAAGCSLATVNRRLVELARLLPESPRPLADPAVVVEGRRLYVRRGDGLAEPSGQLLMDFDAARPQSVSGTKAAGPVAIPFVAALREGSARRSRGPHPMAAEDLRALAEELEENGREDQAVDVYRAILVSGDFTADDHFALAELLYRAGDLAAARERYYMAIELDEDFVEARSNLGCVLAEQGDMGLAEAAFRGALEYHPDYADAHYHLARLLDRANRRDEASRHWQLFMNLAPASPWADEARDRLAKGGSQLSAVSSRPGGRNPPDTMADSR
jgi:tetratricopeptide (TPR) repeat protein